MEQVRTDASKANKIIKLVMSGKGSISSLTSNMMSPSPPRQRSASPHRNESATSSALLKDNRQSKSASAADFEKMGGPQTMYRHNEASTGPQPYISPYETNPAAV